MQACIIPSLMGGKIAKNSHLAHKAVDSCVNNLRDQFDLSPSTHQPNNNFPMGHTADQVLENCNPTPFSWSLESGL